MSSLSDAAAQRRYDELTAAQSAFDLAVSERTVKEPLSGSASTNAWELLYNAAKEFSESAAYTGIEFPNTASDALCVLCQQPLADEAKDRMKRFRRFIEDRTAATLRQRKQALKEFSDSITALGPSDEAALDILCEDIAPFSSEAPAALREFHGAVTLRKQAAQLTLANQPTADVKVEWPAVPAAPLALIDDALAALDTRVSQVTAASKPEEARALAKNGAELKSRKALSARKADIAAHIVTLKRNDLLTRAAETIKTNEISIQGKALIKESLTPALTSALLEEQETLSAGHIKLSMRPAGSVGETTHEMLIDGLPSGVKVKLSQVLSEGEQRVIAIAGFFAELSTAQHGNPVVFDDPVSSLDHEFTGNVAMRLAKEGLTRQVVVFSHDIAFLMELQDAVEELGKAGTPVPLRVQTLKKIGSDAGIGSEGFPWHAQKVAQRVEALEQDLRAIAPLHSSNRDAYNEAAANLYGRLREAWEACVEDDLLDAVVCRYRNSVKPGVLYGVAIEDGDVLAIDRSYSKCSKWMRGHDKSKVLTVNRPAPAEVVADIAELRQATNKFRKGHAATKKNRESKIKA